MNERLVQDIFHLNSRLEKQRKAISSDNAFLFFQLEYEHYFLPLLEEILPFLEDHLSFVKKENTEDYLSLVKQEWINLLEFQIKRKKLKNFATESICDYIVKDLNNYLEENRHHRKNQDELKHYLTRFLLKKGPTIAKIIRDDFELGLNTISSLKSPYIQFQLIQYNLEIKTILKMRFSSMSEYERYYFLSNYFFYPKSPDIDVYFAQEVGESKIHIKLCRDVLGDYYKSSKKFLRGQQL